MIGKMKGLVRKIKQKLDKKWINFVRDRHIGKRVEMSVSDLYSMQICGDELMRYDIIVRYLAIEQFYNKNSVGWDLYEKMQKARKGDGYEEKAVVRFQALIQSFARGYDEESLIVVDKKLRLVDGSHRMALCIYHGIKKVNVLILNADSNIDYSTDWFFKNNFSKEMIDALTNMESELRSRLRTPFSCIIWSPAIPFYRQIMQDMSYYGEIVRYKEFVYRPDEYNNIVKTIYAIDDIQSWKIKAKLDHMHKYESTLVLVDILLDCPDFRLKKATNLPLSKKGERIKKTFRTKYSSYIEDYYFDIIMHMADNYLQSDYIHHVLEPEIDGEAIVGILNKYQYALCKTEVPYFPADFPKHIPIGKDIDIVCAEKDFHLLTQELIGYAKQQKEYRVRVIEKPFNRLIRYEFSNILIFQIDISTGIDKLKEGFVQDAVSAREDAGGYFRLNHAYEYVYRMIAYDKRPEKLHHRQYLLDHKEDFDESFVKKYCALNLQKLLRKG